MIVNDLESRMWDCYSSGEVKKNLYPKSNKPEPRGKILAGLGVCFTTDI